MYVTQLHAALMLQAPFGNKAWYTEREGKLSTLAMMLHTLQLAKNWTKVYQQMSTRTQ